MCRPGQRNDARAKRARVRALNRGGGGASLRASQVLCARPAQHKINNMDGGAAMMDANMACDQHHHAAHAAHAAHAMHADPSTQLAKQLAVAHVCDHRCRVQHLFGNAYRCETSGQVHVCDLNCTQRVYQDRYSTVCRISRRVFASAGAAEPLPRRKRDSGCDDGAGGDCGGWGFGGADGGGAGGGSGRKRGPAQQQAGGDDAAMAM